MSVLTCTYNQSLYKNRLTLCVDWWGFELVLPPPTLTYLQVGPVFVLHLFTVFDLKYAEGTVDLEDCHQLPHRDGDRQQWCARDSPLHPVHLPIPRIRVRHDPGAGSRAGRRVRSHLVTPYHD